MFKNFNNAICVARDNARLANGGKRAASQLLFDVGTHRMWVPLSAIGRDSICKPGQEGPLAVKSEWWLHHTKRDMSAAPKY